MPASLTELWLAIFRKLSLFRRISCCQMTVVVQQIVYSPLISKINSNKMVNDKFVENELYIVSYEPALFIKNNNNKKLLFHNYELSNIYRYP